MPDLSDSRTGARGRSGRWRSGRKAVALVVGLVGYSILWLGIYRIEVDGGPRNGDPVWSSPVTTVSAGLPSSARAAWTPPATPPTIAVPQVFAGTWTGAGDPLLGREGAWTARLELRAGSTTGTLETTGWHCSAKLSITARQTDHLDLLAERNDTEGANCGQWAGIRLTGTRLSGHLFAELAFSWQGLDDLRDQASARLSRS